MQSISTRAVFASALAAATVCVPAQAAVTLLNGDFEQGAISLSSGLVQAAFPSNQLWDEGTFTVGDRPTATHSNWIDPIGSTGNMLIVNGGTSANVPVWSQQVTGAVAGQSYLLTASFASVHRDESPAMLRFSVDDMQVGSIATVAETRFTTYSVTFNAPGDTFKLRLFNGQLAAYGNDFAVDNIAIASVPEPAEWALLLAGLLVVLCASSRSARSPFHKLRNA